jgi:hypothetical protein
VLGDVSRDMQALRIRHEAAILQHLHPVGQEQVTSWHSHTTGSEHLAVLSYESCECASTSSGILWMLVLLHVLNATADSKRNGLV